MPATPGQLAAAYARDSATNLGGAAYLKLSAAMCWDAVLLCVRESGALSGSALTALGVIAPTQFSGFVRMIDPLVPDAAAMRLVPQGSLLAFVEHKDNIPTLIHAMIATGHGLAAGNKNACIGIGNPVGWEILDLAGGLDWRGGTNCFNAVPRGQAATRLVQIRYRAL